MLRGASSLVPIGCMADQRKEEVRKGAHCAWQIHYHSVFPVKYCMALLDEEVTAIIQETAAEIADRLPIESVRK